MLIHPEVSGGAEAGFCPLAGPECNQVRALTYEREREREREWQTTGSSDRPERQASTPRGKCDLHVQRLGGMLGDSLISSHGIPAVDDASMRSPWRTWNKTARSSAVSSILIIQNHKPPGRLEMGGGMCWQVSGDEVSAARREGLDAMVSFERVDVHRVARSKVFGTPAQRGAPRGLVYSILHYSRP